MLILAFWKHAEKHYTKGGKPTDELHCYKSALRPLRVLYGRTQVSEFGPLRLTVVQEHMVTLGWKRTYINKSINRLRHLFKWGVSRELVPGQIYQDLKTVEGLQKGRTEAPESIPRHPVPQEHVNAVKRVVRQRTRDLIDLQLLTAARSGELLSLTTRMINTTADVWIARLDDHKTVHYGKGRTLFFGPRARLILRRYLKPTKPDELLFGGYTVNGYRWAIVRACERLGIARWTPHWLRHSCATKIREEFGVEVAHEARITTDQTGGVGHHREWPSAGPVFRSGLRHGHVSLPQEAGHRR